MCGTPSYLAPEVVKQDNGEGYDNVVDSWSVGVIVFSMYGSRITPCGWTLTSIAIGLQIPVPSLMMILREIFAFELLNVALTGLLSLTPMRVSVSKVSNSVMFNVEELY